MEVRVTREEVIEPDDTRLEHAGIKGMKWGVRRYQNKDGSLTPEGKKRYDSADSQKVTAIRKKNISEMSNQELKDANYRLNLEKQYKDLTKKKSIGKKAVTAFIATAGTIVAIEGAAKTYERIGRLALEKISKMSVG